MKLSRRLLRLHERVDNQAHSIWDIGCDHGQLGLSFLETAGVEEINLVDPSGPVIETLKRTLLDSYITIPNKIKILHQKGQSLTLNSERKAIFIAGMGGKEVIEIATSVLPQLNPEDLLIISPHRKLLEVREWLMKSELRLYRDEVVLDEGRFYPVISLKRDPNLPIVDPFGTDLWQSEEGKLWRKREMDVYKCHKDELSIRFYTYLKAQNH